MRLIKEGISWTRKRISTPGTPSGVRSRTASPLRPPPPGSVEVLRVSWAAGEKLSGQTPVYCVNRWVSPSFSQVWVQCRGISTAPPAGPGVDTGPESLVAAMPRRAIFDRPCGAPELPERWIFGDSGYEAAGQPWDLAVDDENKAGHAPATEDGLSSPSLRSPRTETSASLVKMIGEG